MLYHLCNGFIAHRRHRDFGFFQIGLHLIFTIHIGHKTAIHTFHTHDGTNQRLAIAIGHLAINAFLALISFAATQIKRVAFDAIS